MDSPSPPPVPDPVKTAQAQAQYNEEAARLTAQLSRYNQVTPYGSLNWTNNGNDNWTSTTTLDPRVQSLLDAYLQTSQGMAGATQNAVENVNNAFSTPINYSGLPAAGNAQQSLQDARSQFANLNPAIGGAEQLTGLGDTVAGKAGAQWADSMKPLDYSGVDPLWKPNDQTRQQVTDALYGQYTRQLDPRFAQQENQERSTLMNRGLVEGSEPWNTEMGNFERAKNDAYNQANTSAITGATDQMTALLRDSLAARQQGVTEANNLWQAPQDQALKAMTYAQGANSTLGNLVGLQDSQVNSSFNNANTAFNMQNTQRQDALTEQEQARAMALQWLASLRNGTQPQMPQFQGQQGPNVQPSNYSGDVYNSYNGQMQQYQSQVGSQNALLGMLGQLGGLGAMMFSDRRLKHNIERIGTLSDGTPWYKFDYLWGEHSQGVMADEAPARAVLRHPSGFLMVDYSKLEY